MDVGRGGKSAENHRLPPAGFGRIVGHDARAGPAGLGERARDDDLFRLVEPPGECPVPRVGALVTGPAAPYTVRFDDVSLDVVP